MDPIEEAIAAIESRDAGDNIIYQDYATFFNVNRVTLTQRHQGCQHSRASQYCNQLKLTPNQEQELVLYIGDLTQQGLPRTRPMIHNMGSTIAHQQLSKAWVILFPNRHPHKLVSKWSTGMDATCHKADFHLKYKLYFDLLYSKMKEYNVLPENLYNMNEKGFMIGVIGR
jgi:hypothetical protein